MTSASKKLLKDLPSKDEMDRIIGELKPQGDRAIAILGVSYIEHVIEKMLAASFVSLSKEEYNKIFNSSQKGFLSAFSPKIKLAYALNMLGPDTNHDLNLINDIRIVFAHSLHLVDFSNHLIKADCLRLNVYKKYMDRPERKHSELDAIDAFLQAVLVIWSCIVTKIIHINTESVQYPLDDYMNDLVSLIA